MLRAAVVHRDPNPYPDTAQGQRSSKSRMGPTRHLRGGSSKASHRTASTADPWPLPCQENPFDESSFKLEHDSLQRASIDRSSTPTIGERITNNITEWRHTMDTLCTHAEHFDQLDAINYIGRLERQNSAFQVGHEAKKKHIAALTAERDELKEKVHRCVCVSLPSMTQS